MPLALLLAGKGYRISGSDRAHDQNKTSGKFRKLEESGIKLCPQDGSGMETGVDMLVVSSAVEETIPDVRAALERNVPIIKRGALLAECFNDARTGIAVAGTSGKSTVTGMIATILLGAGLDPTFVNGGQIRMRGQAAPSGMRAGKGDCFVAEMDESDGSIADYNPALAILNNVALDHKSMEELEALFGDFLARARSAVIVNRDNPRAYALAMRKSIVPVISFGIESPDADLVAREIVQRPDGCAFMLAIGAKEYPAILHVPGKHNISNALASLGVAAALGLDMTACIRALENFFGIHRRMEYIGESHGITVIDDFAHNPDKIAASLQSLKAFNGRLIVMFQPHGFGPLKLMGREMMAVFEQFLSDEDYLLMPEAYYAGGTVDRSVTAKDLIAGTKLSQAHWFETRDQIPEFIRKTARAGDRIVIMGARDDTLHDFARDIPSILEKSEKK